MYICTFEFQNTSIYTMNSVIRISMQKKRWHNFLPITVSLTVTVHFGSRSHILGSREGSLPSTAAVHSITAHETVNLSVGVSSLWKPMTVRTRDVLCQKRGFCMKRDEDKLFNNNDTGWCYNPSSAESVFWRRCTLWKPLYCICFYKTDKQQLLYYRLFLYRVFLTSHVQSHTQDCKLQ